MLTKAYDDASGWRRLAFEAPLLWPLRRALAPFRAGWDWPSPRDIDAAWAPSLPVRFVEAEPKRRRKRRASAPIAPRYDARIHLERVVPMRARNAHDFFNALVWVTLPASKLRLHERQHRLTSGGAPRGARTPEGDGLAQIDEGGAVLLCERSALTALRDALDRRDEAAVVALAERGATVGVVFGHAVFEHAAVGCPAPRVRVHVAPCARIPASHEERVTTADELLSAELARSGSFADPAEARSITAVPAVFGR